MCVCVQQPTAVHWLVSWWARRGCSVHSWQLVGRAARAASRKARTLKSSLASSSVLVASWRTNMRTGKKMGPASRHAFVQAFLRCVRAAAHTTRVRVCKACKAKSTPSRTRRVTAARATAAQLCTHLVHGALARQRVDVLAKRRPVGCPCGRLRLRCSKQALLLLHWASAGVVLAMGSVARASKNSTQHLPPPTFWPSKLPLLWPRKEPGLLSPPWDLRPSWLLLAAVESSRAVELSV